MKLFTVCLLLSSFVFNQYLQEGLYPECSYVIVTEDGWKIHKNKEGRVLSMVSKEKHNEKVGKYSFDKFGNLVPFSDCRDSQKNKKIQSDGNVDVEISVKLFNNKNKKERFLINAGLFIPIGGDALNSSPPGIIAGLTIPISKRLSGEVNMGIATGEDKLMAASGVGLLQINPNSKLKISIGGGLSKINNGTGISGISVLYASYPLPFNLNLNAKYQKYIDIQNEDGLEFDFSLLDAFSLSLNYGFKF